MQIIQKIEPINFKCSLTKALELLNNDLILYVKNASYYLENSNLIGDFEITHQDKKFKYLDFSGTINLEDYPLFKQLDLSKFAKNKRVFNFKIKRNNQEIKLKIKLNSQFNSQPVSNAQLISELNFEGINNIEKLVNFKKEIIQFKKENIYKIKKVKELIRNYKKHYKFEYDSKLINRVKIGFRRIAAYLQYFKNESLINIISEESISKRFYLLCDENNAKFYAQLMLFYNLNYAEIIEENYAYINFCEKFQKLKSVDLFLSLIHISEPTRPPVASRMPSSA